MNDREALLQGVLDAPDDDAPRLVFADWLEEQGETQRAELIRVQCRIAYLEAEGAGRLLSPLLDLEYVPLKRRERELLKGHRLTWLPPACMALESQRAGDACQWHRGFVESVSCTLAAWLEHGPAVVQCQPVREVRATDREPYHNAAGCWLWEREGAITAAGQSVLPQFLFERLTGDIDINNRNSWRTYATREAALAALSAACIAWAMQAVTTTA